LHPLPSPPRCAPALAQIPSARFGTPPLLRVGRMAAIHVGWLPIAFVVVELHFHLAITAAFIKSHAMVTTVPVIGVVIEISFKRWLDHQFLRWGPPGPGTRPKLEGQLA